MAAPLRLALFDCDGTLVDSFAAMHDAMGAACLECGQVAPTPDQHRAVMGIPPRLQMQRFYPQLDAAQHQPIVDAFFRHFRGAAQVEPLYPGAREVLHQLDTAGWLMGVATAKSSRGLQKNLDDHGLHHHFLNLQTIDTNPAKPNPEMVLKAMRSLGVDMANTVMIGDSIYDMEMARNAGVLPIGVAWGYHDARSLTAAGARTIAPDFASLPALLAELMPCES